VGIFPDLTAKLEELEKKVAEGGEKGKKAEGAWAAFAAIGSFVLYFLGYLTLRFHLTAFGVSTDLAVLDERYLFAGAQFLVYLVSSIPTLVLILLLPALAAYLLRRKCQSVFHWFDVRPNLVLGAGVLLSVFLIQFIVRKCLVFTNLLLQPTLPEPVWMAQDLLLDADGGIQAIYFRVLLGSCAVTLGLWLMARRHRAAASRAGSLLLATLAGVQFLFLPVTFGILITDKEVPRVVTLNGKDPLPAGQTAWRIWEGKDGVVFLVRDETDSRTLSTIDKKEIKRTDIVGYDRILNVLFGGKR
jgi:hypothetical protein